ncbi:MAG: site-specific DNA-methyltransferase [Prevotella sp.]|jgi:adenine-specific DNA-methyltransferase|nr:site-specific DNA-methyltransferase [Prevotella sp.]MCH4017310.1 site-specific DNA-methyltransferase [Prevotella sp.]MCI1325386.1 site-specific DNA-methyltransferase [Prevotella sp.]
MVKNNKDTIDKIKKSQTLTDKEKSTLLGLLQMRKRYGLVWEDKPEDVEKELEEKLPVFTEVKERALINDTKDLHNPNHILIEGDNLHALTALSYTHAGKIDVIYIDPPYNTGNKDFVYNDKFVDSEDTYRHSKWLSFMSKRLKIAKQLLSEKGVIFISIDDNEQAQLKLLCDEIFGERNFVETFHWVKTSTPAHLASTTSKTTEYVVCYQRTKANKKFIGVEKHSNSSNGLLNQSNALHVLEFPANKVLTRIQDQIVKAKVVKTKSYTIDLLKNTEVKHGIFIKPIKLKARFKWSQAKLNYEIAHGTLITIPTKQFSPSYMRCSYETAAPQNLINQETSEVGTNEEGSTVLFNILGENNFSFPKPISLVQFIIKMLNNKNSIILDFFAGSGTTLHATMQLNEEDGGHRQCILVTNNENHICEEVTYERNKRVIEGYTTPKGEPVEGLHHNNLRYYKTDFVPRDRTMKNMRTLVSKATDMLCIKEDLYQEVPEFGKLKLPKSIARHFTNGIKEMLIIYREECIDELVDVIMDMDFEKKLKVYVFSPDRDPFEDEFEEVEDKVETCALPAAIYDAYIHVLSKRKDKPVEIAPESEKDYENEEWDINDGEDEV